MIEGLARFIMQQLFIAVRIREGYPSPYIGHLEARSKSMKYSAFLDAPLGTNHKIRLFHCDLQIDFCHKRGKLLRDIKLSNILLSISEGQLPIVKIW